MKSAKSIRNGFLIKDLVTRVLKPLTGKIIIYFIIYLVGLVLGLIITQSYSSDIEIERLTLTGVIDFIAHNRSFWGLFFLKFFFMLILCLLAMLSSKSRFFIWINYVVIIVLGYLLGYNIIIVFTTFSFLSLILFMIFYPLLELTIMALYFVILASCVVFMNQVKKFGKICALKSREHNYKILYLIIILLLFILIFVQCLLLIPIKYTMIIVI